MKRLYIVVTTLLILAPTQVSALISCTGIPRFVYAGYHGPTPAENSFGVELDTVAGILNLGQTSDTQATARYSMMLAAQRAQSTVILEFFNHSPPDDCDTVVQSREVPTSVYTR
ncbi:MULTISPECIES: hypothetical protein [Aliagarivorans]|uniref:hypothetical protein n=1 Tax=Aliagarivorans TaxID=882379 RepID=UPI0004788898|nr:MULTISPECIES: hypothetical protein [Aliagarivorans]